MAVTIHVYENRFLGDNPSQTLFSSKCPVKEVSGADNKFVQIDERIEFPRQLREELCGSVPSAGVKIITYMDNIQTPLIPAYFLEFFASIGIEIVQYQNIEYVFSNLGPNPLTTYFVVIHSSRHDQHLTDQAHSYHNIRAMYIQCETKQLVQQRRLGRKHPKLEGVFDDSIRLLIKVMIDIALFCEETADRQKNDASTKGLAQRNYQRSVDLYTFAEKLIHE